MDKNLRLFAGHILISSKLSKSAKSQLLNFVKEDATDSQIKALLMDGEILSLDEQTEEIVNSRFDLFVEKNNLKGVLEFVDLYTLMYKIGARDGFIAAAFIAAVTSAGEMVYKRFFSKAARACQDKSGIEKTSCMTKFKNNATKEKIKVYQKGMSMCNKSKTPDQCKAKLRKKIGKAKATLGE